MLTSTELREKYRQLNFASFALKNPDTVIGLRGKQAPAQHYVAKDVEVVAAEDDSTSKRKRRRGGGGLEERIQFEEVSFARSPAHYKCFDEMWVNAVDQFLRLAYVAERETPDREALLAWTESMSQADWDQPDVAESVLSYWPEVEQLAHTLIRGVEVPTSLSGTITPEFSRVANNGDGIDVAEHPDVPGVYIPQFLFTNAHTSTNYEANENDCCGGKNGVGMPSVLAHTTKTVLVTKDRFRRLVYTQTYEDHLNVLHPPTITPWTKDTEPGTEVTIWLDFPLFESTENDQPFIDYARRRVVETLYYLCANQRVRESYQRLKVEFNGISLPLPTSLQSWPTLYRHLAWHSVAPSWALTPSWHLQLAMFAKPVSGGMHMSMVNGVRTEMGGTHVDYVVSRLVRLLAPKMAECVERHCRAEKICLKTQVDEKHARGVIEEWPKLTAKHLQRRLAMFLTCDVKQPVYEGQCKDRLGQKIQSSTVLHWEAGRNMFETIPESMNKWCEMTLFPALLYDLMCPIHESLFHQRPTIVGAPTVEEEGGDSVKLTKAERSVGREGRVSVDSLNDAVKAGTAEWRKCELIFTEGDSACSGIVSANPKGNEYVGTFAASGKIKTVKSDTFQVLMRPMHDKKKNVVRDLVISLGLAHYRAGRHTKVDVEKMMRYGRLTLICDQDFDGIHIQCSVVKLVDTFFHELLKWFPDFLWIQSTPLVEMIDKSLRSTALKDRLYFYTEEEAVKFQQAHPTKSFVVRYLKGLGSSNEKQFQQYFRITPPTRVVFEFTPEERKVIQEAFDDSAEDKQFRKTDLCGDPESVCLTWNEDRTLTTARLNNGDELLDLSKMREITVTQLFTVNLRAYRRYAMLRGAPGEDGLKWSERKLIWGAWKHFGVSGTKPPIKVGQLGNKCADEMRYHHGEKSLVDSLIAFTAAHYGQGNNVHLFRSEGQFGQFATDFKAAAPRYNFVDSSPVFSAIFRPEDEPVLELELDEKLPVEPRLLAPIVPLSMLINQTGFQTGITHQNAVFRVEDVLTYLRALIPWIHKEESHRTVQSVHACRDPECTIPRWTATPHIYEYEGTMEMRTSTPKEQSQYVVLQRGTYVRESPTSIRITAIPPLVKYKGQFCKLFEQYEEGLKADPKVILPGWEQVASYEPFVQLDRIRRLVKFKTPEAIETLEQQTSMQSGFPVNGVEKHFLLAKAVYVHLRYVNAQGKIQTFQSFEELVWQYAQLRWWMYLRRRNYWVAQMEDKIVLKEQQAAFIELLRSNDGAMQAWRECDSKEVRRGWLETHQFLPHPRDGTYEYLWDLSLDHLSKDQVAKLRREVDTLQQKQHTIATTPVATTWLEELDHFEHVWREECAREVECLKTEEEDEGKSRGKRKEPDDGPRKPRAVSKRTKKVA